MATEEVRPTLTALELGDPPERWEALGFTVVDGAIELAGVRLSLGAARAGHRALAPRRHRARG